MKTPEYDLLIVGGGLGGLALAQLVARSGWKVLVLEKGRYPQHKVCGEYLSEEVRPFLNSLGLPLEAWNLPKIRRLEVSDHSGRVYSFRLQQGGFGLSRYQLDQALAQQAQLAQVTILEGETVMEVQTQGNYPIAITKSGLFSARMLVGAWGKRAHPDLTWKRSFIQKRPNALNQFIAVKHHFELPSIPDDLIRLDNFQDGYAGMSQVEAGIVCCCYLSRASNLRKAGGNIQRMEREILEQNPRLKAVFSQAKPLYERPLSISQVSFEAKEQSKDGVLFLGDAAGLIAPLSGNGMSMALRSAWMAAPLVLQCLAGEIDQATLVKQYDISWKQAFESKLRIGRGIQTMFGNKIPTQLLLKTVSLNPLLASWLIRQTHGTPFE